MTLPLEDELDVLDEDIRATERRLDDLGRERSRVANEPEIGQAMSRLRDRLRVMREEREVLAARLEEDEAEGRA